MGILWRGPRGFREGSSCESSLRPRGDEMQALVATRARGQVELLQL